MPRADLTESEIRDWCIGYLKRMVDDPTITVAPHVTLAEMGLDSASSAYFIVELEEWLGIELEPELVADYPTIDDLARHLTTRQDGGDVGAG